MSEGERAGEAVPKGTSHIAERATGRTLCGRKGKSFRVHHSWPICKSCLRVNERDGRAWDVIYGPDGWSIDTSSNGTTTSANNFQVIWYAA